MMSNLWSLIDDVAQTISLTPIEVSLLFNLPDSSLQVSSLLVQFIDISRRLFFLVLSTLTETC